MYSSHFEIVYNQIVEGVDIKILHRDDSMLMTEFILQKGSKLPDHIHLEDHSAYLLKGKIRITTNGNVKEFVHGDSWCIKKNICHYSEALEDSVVLEVFNIANEEVGFQIYKKADVIEF